jgi:SAM-dependent methyltransferase
VTVEAAAVWHDVECGSYDADLRLWEELSAEGATVLDLGCGTGRVALYLARRGRRVTGIDRDGRFLETLELRAAERDLSVETVCADAREFDLATQFDAVFAPMQLVQLFRGPSERGAMLDRAARHLRPGGVFAATLMDLEGELVGDEYGPPPPDVREVDQWVYSSLSVAVELVERGRAVRIERLRTVVSPQGEQSTSVDEVRLELVPPATLEKEIAAAGLEPRERRTIPATDDHVGSVVVTATRPEIS